MDDIAKLKHLLGHWAEHNSEHAKSYLEWSRKAEMLGKKELAEKLKKISEDTVAIERLFQEAISLC